MDHIFFCSYLVGAIPTGYLFAKYFFDVDITKEGSGNIGATNSARVLGGVKYFFLIFLLDAGKAFGLLFYFTGGRRDGLMYSDFYPYGDSIIVVMAMMIIIGNSYSCFLNLRGGKGVATLIGIIAVLAPVSFTISLLLIWGLLFAYFRKVDAASLLALIVSLFIYRVFFYAQYFEFMYFLLFAFVWLCIRHQSNIQVWISSYSQKSK